MPNKKALPGLFEFSPIDFSDIADALQAFAEKFDDGEFHSDVIRVKDLIDYKIDSRINNECEKEIQRDIRMKVLQFLDGHTSFNLVIFKSGQLGDKIGYRYPAFGGYETDTFMKCEQIYEMASQVKFISKFMWEFRNELQARTEPLPDYHNADIEDVDDYDDEEF